MHEHIDLRLDDVDVGDAGAERAKAEGALEPMASSAKASQGTRCIGGRCPCAERRGRAGSGRLLGGGAWVVHCAPPTMRFEPPADSLAVRFPELAAEWHPTKNGALTPAHVTLGTRHKAWWRCKTHPTHVWQASIANRAGVLRRGCPMCAHRVVTRSSSLRGAYPELAKQWHPTANAPLTPDNVVAGSRHRITWVCPADSSHVWQATLNNRTVGKTGCPMCANKKISPERSLLSRYPKIARDWHPTKNGKLTPAQVFGATARKVWWQCPKEREHIWSASVANRTLRGSGCPMCAGSVASSTTSLRARPELAAEWHPTRNGRLRPDEVMCRSTRRVWWRCSRNPRHVWQASVASRAARSTGCPKCAGAEGAQRTSKRHR